jgi:hypothetical protein
VSRPFLKNKKDSKEPNVLGSDASELPLIFSDNL